MHLTLLDNRPCFGCFCAKTIIFFCFYTQPLHAGNLLTWVFALHPNSDWLLKLLFTTKCLKKVSDIKKCYLADNIFSIMPGRFHALPKMSHAHHNNSPSYAG